MNKERSKNIVALVGTIGTGKSTLADRLGTELNGVVLKETVEGNAFMRDAHKTGILTFQNQIWFLLQTVERWQKATDVARKGTVAIMDTYTPTNLIHSKISLDNDSFILYGQLVDHLTAHLPPPTVTVYLWDSVDFLMDRFRNKQHVAVNDDDELFVTRMSNIYDEWSKTTITPSPMIRIRSRDLEDASLASVYINEIRKQLER
jgi:deoxyadenosine/deoxycytidine kinase